MIGVEPYEIHASGALFLLAVIAAITLISWATRPQQGDRSRLPAWAWSVLATVGGVLVALAISGFFFAVYLFYPPSPALGRDLDGRYAQSPLRPWFDHLRSRKGTHCCTDADGVTIKDVDWDTDGVRYRVRLKGQWIVVPDGALITEPNRYGPAVVWPMPDPNGGTTIRCFMPGAMT